jgi:hypothetical protein
MSKRDEPLHSNPAREESLVCIENSAAVAPLAPRFNKHMRPARYFCQWGIFILASILRTSDPSNY